MLDDKNYINETITEHFPFCCCHPHNGSLSRVSRNRFGVKIHIPTLGEVVNNTPFLDKLR